MELLFISMLVAYYMTRNTVQDLAWKARGEDPPSFRREQERIRRREARRPLTDKRAARKFWANAWADAWEAAGEKRERIHNKRQERRRSEWERQDLEDTDEINDGDHREPEPKGSCDLCGAQVATDLLVRRAVGHDLKRVCPGCAAYVDANPKPHGIPPEPPRHPQPDPYYHPDIDPDLLPELIPADTGDRTGDAQIIQFADLQRPNTSDQETDMNSSGETTNLGAALSYTSSMAISCREGVTSVDTSLAGLRGGGVTGPTLDALSQAMEALNMAAAAFSAAHQALRNHIAVQEAYAANADAGDRQFVTAD